MKKNYKETDLYEPIKTMLTAQGFTVKGEVKKCDIAAVKDDELWVVEMKLGFNMTLLYQALDRFNITNNIFVAVPRPKRETDKNYRNMIKVLKKLEIGLITVSLDSPLKRAEIILFPGKTRTKNNKATERVRAEIENRKGDSAGGTNKGVNTAYRERSIRIACLLANHGPLTGSDLVKKYGCEKDSTKILYANYYNWFESDGGKYAISNDGRKYLIDNENNAVVTYYRMKSENFLFL